MRNLNLNASVVVVHSQIPQIMLGLGSLLKAESGKTRDSIVICVRALLTKADKPESKVPARQLQVPSTRPPSQFL